MKASLVVIGTELTRGLVQDTHTKNIAFMLSGLRIDVASVFIVPDSRDVRKYIALASDDSDLIITTGGLGPTNDDMTRFELSSHLSLNLIKNEKAVRHIRAMLSKPNETEIDESNLNQALIPEGFELIENDKGTALGFYGKSAGKFYISLPGPPFELSAMMDSVKNIVSSYIPCKPKDVYTYTLFAVTEAHFNELTNQFLRQNKLSDEDIVVGTCYKEFRVLVYLYTAFAALAEKFTSWIDVELRKEEEDIQRLFSGDIDVFNLLASKLIEKGYTICLAESITGGLIAKKFTDIPGSSQWFCSSVVSYSDEIKKSMLGVNADVIRKYSAVSAKCAEEMAIGVQKLIKADLALSITGYAGPSGEDVGKCFMAVKFKDSKPIIFEHNVLRSTRIGTRNACSVLLILHALDVLEKA